MPCLMSLGTITRFVSEDIVQFHKMRQLRKIKLCNKLE